MPLSDSLINAYRAAKMPEADIQAMIEQRRPDITLFVLPENLPILNMLTETEACWIYHESGVRIGFRYADASAVLDWSGIDADTRKMLPTAVNAILAGDKRG